MAFSVMISVSMIIKCVFDNFQHYLIAMFCIRYVKFYVAFAKINMITNKPFILQGIS